MTWPYEVRRDGVLLEQIDGAVHFDGLACLVEAKAWKKQLDYSVIAKMKAQLLRRPMMTLGAVFQVGVFSEAAVNMTHLLPPPNVLLWPGVDVDWALKRRALREGMRLKLRHAIEQGFGDLGLSEREEAA